MDEESSLKKRSEIIFRRRIEDNGVKCEDTYGRSAQGDVRSIQGARAPSTVVVIFLPSKILSLKVGLSCNISTKLSTMMIISHLPGVSRPVF